MLSKYFGLYELVHPLIYKNLIKANLVSTSLVNKNSTISSEKANQRARMLFHPNLVSDLNLIREFYACPIIVNTWHKNKNICNALIDKDMSDEKFLDIVTKENISNNCFINRGLRLLIPEVGTSLSTHVFGYGIDFIITSIEQAIEAYETETKRIIKRKLSSAKRFELGIKWIHMDYLGKNIEPVTFYPS